MRKKTKIKTPFFFILSWVCNLVFLISQYVVGRRICGKSPYCLYIIFVNLKLSCNKRLFFKRTKNIMEKKNSLNKKRSAEGDC